MSALSLVPFIGHGAGEITSIITTATRAAATIGSIGSEVFTAGAILWTLNTAGTAIEKTYNAGKAVGSVYYSHIKPVTDQIDWAEVGALVWSCLLSVAVAFYVAGQFTGKAFYSWHANHVGHIDWTVPTFEPIVATFDGLNVKQLRILAREEGIKGINKLRKAELIAALS